MRIIAGPGLRRQALERTKAQALSVRKGISQQLIAALRSSTGERSSPESYAAREDGLAETIRRLEDLI